MGKWVGRIFYAILVIFMTFFVIQSAYDARSNAYLAENMTGEWDNEAQFFKGINTLLNLDYMTNESIIPAYVDDSGAHRLKLQLFGLGYTDNEGNHLDGVMIYINNIVIYERDEITNFMRRVENPFIRLTIYTDEPTDATATDYVSYTGFEGQNFAAGFIFDQESSEIAYDLVYYVNSNGDYLSSTHEPDRDEVPVYASITRIDVDYSNGTSEDGAFVYETESLMIVSDQSVDDPVFDDSFKFSDFSYDPEDYRLEDDLNTWPVTVSQATALNLFIERDSIDDYNWHMIRVFLLYAGFVIIVTYLLFFHKKTMAYFRQRHAAKIDGDGSGKTAVDAKPTEQIFKDVEPKDEDGR